MELSPESSNGEQRCLARRDLRVASNCCPTIRRDSTNSPVRVVLSISVEALSDGERGSEDGAVRLPPYI